MSENILLKNHINHPYIHKSTNEYKNLFYSFGENESLETGGKCRKNAY